MGGGGGNSLAAMIFRIGEFAEMDDARAMPCKRNNGKDGTKGLFAALNV